MPTLLSPSMLPASLICLSACLLIAATTSSKAAQAPQDNLTETLALTSQEKTWLSKHRELRVAASPGWAPVSFLDANGSHQGIAIDYQKQLAKILGVKFTFIPDHDTNTNAQAEILAAIANPASNTPADYIALKNPIMSPPLAIYVRQTTEGIHSLEDLSGKKVAVFQSRHAAETLAKNHPDIQIVKTDIAEEALAAVASGRVDAYLGNLAVVSYVIREQGVSSVKIGGITPYHTDLNIGVRSDLPELASILGKALAAISEEDRNAISRKWVSVTFEHRTDYQLVIGIAAGALLLIGMIGFWAWRLNIEVSRRRAAEQEIERARQMLQLVLDTVPIEVFWQDSDGRYLGCNRMFAANAGLASPEQIQGLTEAQLTNRITSPEFTEHNAQVLASGNDLFWQDEFIARNHQQPIWYQTNRAALRDTAGNVIGLLVTLEDISDYVAVLDGMKRRDAVLQGVAYAASKLLGSENWQTDITQILQRLGNGGIKKVAIYQLQRPQPADTAGVCLYQWQHAAIGQSGDAHPDAALQFIVRTWGESLRHGEVICRQTRALNSAEQGCFAERDIQSFFIAPIHAGTHWWGFLEIQEFDPAWEWSEAEIEALHIAAETLGAAIQRNQNEEALQEAMARAESANLAKTQFLANMSHEIRTPLNGILGMAQLLLSPSTSPSEQQSFARTIHESGCSLLAILNDILDISKIEAGKMEIEHAPFDAVQLAADSLQLFSEVARAKQIALHLNKPAEDMIVLGDAVRVRQVLSNLVSNAVKFSEAGAVNVTLSRQPAETADGRFYLRFDITDSGIGIDEATQARLFQSFSQADNSITRRFGGTGLGLSIARQLCQLMGGDIGVTSEPGKGANFWFTILTRQTQRDQQAQMPTAVPQAAPSINGRSRILVAEDNRVNTQVICAMLKKLGYAHDIATNGEEAVSLATSRQFDLVLMDYHMPVMDGLLATQAIRHHESVNNLEPLPILALTAASYAEEQHKCLAAGMNSVISKPVRFGELAAAIELYLAKPAD